MSTSNTKQLQKLTNKKGKYKKITGSLKELMREEFVNGTVDDKGIRSLLSVRGLAKKHGVSENTLYKLAQREMWQQKRDSFQAELEKELDEQRIKDFVKASKKFDSESLEIAVKLLQRVGKTITDKQESSFKEFTPTILQTLPLH